MSHDPHLLHPVFNPWFYFELLNIIEDEAHSPQTVELIGANEIGWEMIQCISHVCRRDEALHVWEYLSFSQTYRRARDWKQNWNRPSTSYSLPSPTPFLFYPVPSPCLALCLYFLTSLPTTWIYCSSGFKSRDTVYSTTKSRVLEG